MKKKPQRVADVLEKELNPAIKEWLRRAKLLPGFTHILLNDEDRTIHLPQLYHDLVCRLRLAKDATLPKSAAAAEHGQRRREQGYSPSMLVEESRLFQVVTFQTLHRYQDELDREHLLSDIAVIADEVDFQLVQAVKELTRTAA